MKLVGGKYQMTLLNLQQTPEKKSPLQSTTDTTLRIKDISKQEISATVTTSKQSRKNKLCQQCGKEKGGRGLVCRECYDKNRKIEINLKCNYCNKEYKILKYQYEKAVKRGNENNYCSKSCSCKAVNESRFGKKVCIICNVELKGKGRKYCSDECKKISRIQSGIKNRKLKPILCEVCDVEFYPKSSRTKYCSMECKNEAHSKRMTGLGNSRYIDGMSYNKEFQYMKLIIKERDNNQCVICKQIEKRRFYTKNGNLISKTNLHVHHIDENIKNNTEMNLITVCDKCHMKIHKTKK